MPASWPTLRGRSRRWRRSCEISASALTESKSALRSNENELKFNKNVSQELGFAKQTTWQRKVIILVIGGIAGIVAGYAWNPYFPINKNLWTSSYVLFTAGYAMLALAACYWVVDVRRWRPALLTTPFLALGTNAILAFSLSVFIAKNLLIYKMRMPVSSSVTGPAAFGTGTGIGTGTRVVNAWSWIYLNWFHPS